MRPIGFVICCTEDYFLDCTKDKIYPYFGVDGNEGGRDVRIKVLTDKGTVISRWMYLEIKSTNGHRFDFYHYPEFPKDTTQWTENDWFQYDLKYGNLDINPE